MTTTENLAATLLRALETEAAEAALDEGLANLPERLNGTRERFLVLKALKTEIDAEMKSLRDEIGAELVEQGLQGFTLGGRVVCRFSEVQTSSVDMVKVKKDEPTAWAALFARFGKTTKTERVTIN